VKEKELNYIESLIPTFANSVVQQAYFESLSKGISVVIEEDNKLYEINSNGEKKFLKNIEKQINISHKKIVING